ncbi:polysaccharide deacetylase family protein [Desulfocurvus sp.]|jgi:hypothetical protein|uniref:polysaccharide deacetylase family protein n=1 Tax=Desulfocurvus sp. TaxID=2871698 RepID=UPI0025BB6179|nr:polysaccharide deacetylase family protein [Desulfocurvus sp.]MCK9239449.1 polysaccharide deacetylase family protein [Desulfocurvus sp.]
MPKSLPVLMYHYVSSWPNPIAVDPDVFESHLEGLAGAGYRGVGLAEAEAFLRDGEPLPDKSVLLTFDDGFLDNYVNAWPLLAKHGHKGTIFAVTNKVVEEGLPRPTLDDVWSGFVKMDDLPRVNTPVGKTREGLRIRTDLFFSWQEARLMEASGVVDVAGHTHTHRSVFVGPRFDSLMEAGPRRRTFDRVDHPVLFGLPGFERGPAMAHRAFLPAREVYDMVRAAVPQTAPEAREFLGGEGGQALLRRLKALPAERLGRMETDDEMRARLHDDLSTSHRLLEANLGHPVRTLAWPWGRCCPEALEIAREVGFSVFFTTRVGPNLPGKSADAACRFKARNRGARWLLSRVGIYSRPLLARVYGALRS